MAGPTERREARWRRLGEEPFDLLVVGGGITGAGVARDAALRGARVALVEKGDFGSGTSSRSSRLVHGGLRYLEMYQFGLVFESTHERARLARLAPHVVRPLPFVYPVYGGARPGLTLMRMGMLLYDLLASFRTYRNHRKLGPARIAAEVPALRRDGLRGGFRYYDAITDDGRLTLENVVGAEEAGAVCLNHVRFEAAVQADGRVTGATVVDVPTGRPATVRTPVIVNAVGPWLNGLLPRTGCAQGPRLQPSKGVHVVVPRTRLPVDDAVVMKAVRDGRVVFCVPWGTATYIGTTDTAWDGDPDDVFADAADVAYLLETTNHYFPGQRLVPEDVISTWAGLRPLVAEAGASTYRTSREHTVEREPCGAVVVAGGKLTTYRVMARQTVDAAVALLRDRPGHDLPRLSRCRTRRCPLPGGVGLKRPKARAALRAALLAESGLPAAVLDHLLSKYGARTPRLLAAIAADPSAGRPVVEGLLYVWAEIDFAVEDEHALHLDDVLVRRTHIFYKAADQGRAVAPAVAARLAVRLGWDDPRVEAELAAFRDLADRCIEGARADGAAGQRRAAS
jgi:glycerol-3-phosphate dehydrogenase